MRPGLNKEGVMPDDPKTDPDKGKADPPDPGNDPDAGAKKALEAERKARREAERKAKDLEARLADLEAKGSDKGEVEKLTEQITKLNEDLADERVMRLTAEVAKDKGLTPAHIKRLSGKTREELEESADDLLADFPIPEKKDDKDDDDSKDKGGPPSRRPAADLKGGIDPTEASTETDPAKLAESVPRL